MQSCHTVHTVGVTIVIIVILNSRKNMRRKLTHLSRSHKTPAGSTQWDQTALLLSATFAQSDVFLWPSGKQHECK